MKYTEIPEHWNLSIMYKVNGLSRSIYVRYKTKELAEQEMHKQWKEFCRRYDVAEKDLVMKYGTFCEYSKGGVIYMADLVRIDGSHIYEEPIEIAALCGSLVQPMGHPEVTLQLATPLIKGDCFSSRILEGEMPKEDVKGWVVLSDTEEKEKRKELGEL